MSVLCTAGDRCRGEGAEPRDVWDNGYLCGPCRSRLGRWIGDMPALAGELGEALIPHVPGSGGGPKKGPDGREPERWPVNPAPLGLLQHVYGVLASWTLLVVEERGFTAPRADPGLPGVTVLSAWLTTQVDWVAHQRWAAEMHREVDELRREVFRAVYPSRRYRRIPVGDCPHCGEGTVHVMLPREEREPWVARCLGCDHQWDPWQLHSLQRALAVGA